MNEIQLQRLSGTFIGASSGASGAAWLLIGDLVISLVEIDVERSRVCLYTDFARWTL